MNRVELKKKAKDSLKGKYGQAILITLLLGIISGVISGTINFSTQGLSQTITNGISSVASLIVTSLLVPGYISFFLKISRNEAVTYDELFNKTKLFVPFLILELLIGVFTFLWSLLFIIPGIIAAIAYSLAGYIFIDNPEMDTMEIIKKSKEMMQGHKMDFFVLQLSFLGLLILGLFTCGIYYFWLMPYMTVTEANFYNALKEQSK